MSETKVCSKCKEEKSVDDFHKNRSKPDGLAGECKICILVYQKRRRKERRRTAPDMSEAVYVPPVRRSNTELANRAIVAARLVDGCTECPEMDPACLEFHHRVPANKSGTVSNMMAGPTNALLVELDKCDVLCANCHAKHHGSNWKSAYVRALRQQIEHKGNGSQKHWVIEWVVEHVPFL